MTPEAQALMHQNRGLGWPTLKVGDKILVQMLVIGAGGFSELVKREVAEITPMRNVRCQPTPGQVLGGEWYLPTCIVEILNGDTP